MSLLDQYKEAQQSELDHLLAERKAGYSIGRIHGEHFPRLKLSKDHDKQIETMQNNIASLTK